jgi:hypothetical protein
MTPQKEGAAAMTRSRPLKADPVKIFPKNRTTQAQIQVPERLGAILVAMVLNFRLAPTKRGRP